MERKRVLCYGDSNTRGDIFLVVIMKDMMKIKDGLKY